MANDLQITTKDKEDDDDSSNNAVAQLEQEAKEFLVLSGTLWCIITLILCLLGRRFKNLLELKEDDKRAYMNWGKALCMRSRLEKEAFLKMQLYDAAIVKYEKVNRNHVFPKHCNLLPGFDL